MGPFNHTCNTSCSSPTSRSRRVGSFSDLGLAGEDADAALGAILPELRPLLPGLHVGTRGQAAAAAALSRALADPPAAAPAALVQLGQRRALLLL
jgi:hypothetical protein